MILRENTRSVKINNLILGGNNHIYIQSMTNIKTSNVCEVINQILELEKAGCEIIRVSVLDLEDAKAIKEIKSNINIPLVADIHFDYKLALESIESGADAIRLNPGNLKNEEEIVAVVEACKLRHIPIRVGVNSGSMPDGLDSTPENMIIALKKHLDILEAHDFYDIVIALKSSDVNTAIKAYELAANTFSYPIHVGLTEAGTNYGGLIKSSIAIGKLLLEGIGNTIRVSLTDNPLSEIRAAKQILADLKLRDDIPVFTSCPTCGRIQYNMEELAKRVEEYLLTINKHIHVAVMGCAVNGPGEAKNADIAICGGKNEAILFIDGKLIRKIKEKDIYDELIKEINNYKK